MARNKFLTWKWPATPKRLGRPDLKAQSRSPTATERCRCNRKVCSKLMSLRAIILRRTHVPTIKNIPRHVVCLNQADLRNNHSTERICPVTRFRKSPNSELCSNLRKQHRKDLLSKRRKTLIVSGYGTTYKNQAKAQPASDTCVITPLHEKRISDPPKMRRDFLIYINDAHLHEWS